VKSHYVDVDVNEVVSIVVSIASHMFQEPLQKVKVKTHLSPQLPRVQANYEEIKQALLNIVRNGFEAMEEGENSLSRRRSNPIPLRLRGDYLFRQWSWD